MVWKLTAIWRDHIYGRGVHKGTAHQAFPLWNADRGGYDTFPSNSNELKDAALATSLEELYDHLDRGRGVRCIVPETGYESILCGNFKATFEQP
ncbi:MAG: hypothetical protein ABSC06_32745 [Rhodopila sp.]|jgi:hypothetical protein